MFGPKVITFRTSTTLATTGLKVIEDVPSGDRDETPEGVKVWTAQMVKRREP
jgi:hypothetical protein